MTNSIMLEDEQAKLFVEMVEIVRSMPRDKRRKFIVVQSMSGETLIYPGFPNINRQVFLGDLEVLAHEGLLAPSYSSSGTPNFNITPRGFHYYEQLKVGSGQPTGRTEAAIKSYLDSDNFQKEFPAAHQKWTEAEELLWHTDSTQQLTTIGHLCREAMQEFAETLVQKYNPRNANSNKAHTENRIKAVLNIYNNLLGSTEKLFLDALVSYWRKVSDLVQRQEHGAQKEGRQLVWEDGRRVVFQTAVVMYEVARSLLWKP